MATLNQSLLDHPVAQTFPKDQAAWTDFVRVLVEYTQNPDAIDVAIEGGVSLTDTPTSSRALTSIDALKIEQLQSQASPDRALEKVEALQLEHLQSKATKGRDLNTSEIQLLQTSTSGETQGNLLSPAEGYIPEANVLDPDSDLAFASTPFQQGYSRGKMWWNDDPLVSGLSLYTDAPDHDLLPGRMVSYRVTSDSFYGDGGSYTKGQFVGLTGGQLGLTAVYMAQADTDANEGALGVMMADMALGEFGYAMAFGDLTEMITDPDSDGNTTVVGDPIYLSEITPGGWTVIPPERKILLGFISGHNTSATGILTIGPLLPQTFRKSHLVVDTTTFTIDAWTAVDTPHAAEVILVDDDTATAAVTLTLPPVANKTGASYYIKKLGTTGSVTIDGDGSETIDGATTAVLTAQYESVLIVCDGTEWWIL